jgi:hypothetical protein
MASILVRDVRRHKFMTICLTFPNELLSPTNWDMDANLSCSELRSSSPISFSNICKGLWP